MTSSVNSKKRIGMGLARYSVENPRRVMWATVIVSALMLALAVIPVFSPGLIPGLKPLTVDTDPENMLPHDEPARVFHDRMKKTMSLYDMIVVGIVNEKHPEGVYNISTLTKVHQLTQFASGLDGVIRIDVMAPSTVDDIQQEGLGTVKFNWLMKEPPQSEEEAIKIKERALRIPFLADTIASKDGRALALYLPITEKKKSFAIYSQLMKKISDLGQDGGNRFYVAGLPVAEDVFGVEMFKQMAVAAPLAMVLIFLLMYFFFRNLKLVISPLLVAMVSVIWTMAALIISGNTVHIMSSMIPIFIMPIAVLDTIHILSEFFDKYRVEDNRRETLLAVIDELYTPLLFTTFTTMAGFASLALTPIPPVQVFGVFVAIGVFSAWLLTMMFIPAYIMLMKESSLADFGLAIRQNQTTEARNGWLLGRFLSGLGKFSFHRPVAVLVGSTILCLLAVLGIGKININDNPTKWFEESHSIRLADQVMNQHFAGTYMAYLVFESKGEEPFKDPKNLRYMEGLQRHIDSINVVGKSTSVIDIVKTVHRDLFLADEKKFVIPNSRAAVAQILLTFQNGHRPQDLWHFVDPEYRKFNIWIQMKNGDNQEMEKVVGQVESYLNKNKAPLSMESGWFGLTYINKIWQDKMVAGMLKAFIGSFFIVLFMMIFLFRSVLWGVLSMIPLSVTILVIYGFIGFIGKDYDMPVAVLSSLSLGLAIDYAIHFLARSRALIQENGSWKEAHAAMFSEPARAIFRNIIVVGVGFLPLLFSPLVPYQTVGVFIAAILFLAGFASLVLLPAVIQLLENFFSLRRESK